MIRKKPRSSMSRSIWPRPKRRSTPWNRGPCLLDLRLAGDRGPGRRPCERTTSGELVRVTLGSRHRSLPRRRAPHSGAQARRARGPGGRVRSCRILVLLGVGVRAGEIATHPPDAQVSPLGYGIWAEGLGVVLDTLRKRLPDSPLLVAEYGIGTDNDAERAEYIERGLEVVADAISRGIDVRGLFHWTGVDNYEWLHGFDVAFGIIDRERNVKPSARILQREAKR